MTNQIEKTLKSAKTFLSRWNGRNACIAEITRSHPTLFIHVWRADRPEKYLRIACAEPDLIQSALRWEGCMLEFTWSGTRYTLRDAQKDYRIISEKISFFEMDGHW